MVNITNDEEEENGGSRREEMGSQSWIMSEYMYIYI